MTTYGGHFNNHNANSNSYVVEVSSTGKTNIQGGGFLGSGNCLKISNTSSVGSVVIGGDASVTAQGGYAISTNSAFKSVLTVGDLYFFPSIQGTDAAIYLLGTGTTNISGIPQVIGLTGIKALGGTLNISGGTIEAKAVKEKKGGSGIEIIGTQSDIVLNITGGTITSAYSYAIHSQAAPL